MKIKTFGDMQKLTIQFLNGSINESPTHLGPIADETKPFVRELIAMNELGFVTTNSQPGGPSQRSFLTGIAQDYTTSELRSQLNNAGFVVMTYDIDGRSPSRGPALLAGGITVTIDGGDPFTFVGHYLDEFSCWKSVMNVVDMKKLVRGLREVTVIDPVWGRDPVTEGGLFKSVLQVLRGIA